MFKFLLVGYFIFRFRLFFFFRFLPLGRYLFPSKPTRSTAKRLVTALQKLGPTFIKFGQLLSVREDLVGKVFAEELSHLREQTTFSNLVDLKEPLSSLGKGLVGELLTQSGLHVQQLFDEKLGLLTPVAAGSVAQVYKLSIKENHPLAVKVLKPGIKKKILTDLKFLSTLFKLVENKVERAKRSKLSKVVEELHRITAFEADLKFEAAALSQLKENLEPYTDISYVPKVHWSNTRSEILVMEWLEGVKLSEVLFTFSAEQKELLAKNLLYLFFVQVALFGFYHADLHPGNFVILQGGKIGYFDLGIVGTLDDPLKGYVFRVWKAFLNQKYDEAAQLHVLAGWVSNDYSKKDLALAIRTLVDPLFEVETSEREPGSRSLFAQLLEITDLFGMEVQPKLLLVQKNMIFLESIVNSLAPGKIWAVARDIVNKEEFKPPLKNKTKQVLARVAEKVERFGLLIDNQLLQSNFESRWSARKTCSNSFKQCNLYHRRCTIIYVIGFGVISFLLGYICSR